MVNNMLYEVGRGPSALPLKCQDLTSSQWIQLWVAVLLFIFSAGAFIVVGYCTVNVCEIAFGSAGGAMLICALCLSAHLVRYATLFNARS